MTTGKCTMDMVIEKIHFRNQQKVLEVPNVAKNINNIEQENDNSPDTLEYREKVSIGRLDLKRKNYKNAEVLLTDKFLHGKICWTEATIVLLDRMWKEQTLETIGGGEEG